MNSLLAQPDTEVYLLRMHIDQDSIILDHPVNISNNPGYDNQPSFDGTDTLLFASTRKTQTDIRQYAIADSVGIWLSDTPGGSEYSPLRIPGQAAVSAIRLDTDGKQLLYRYDLHSGSSTALFEDLKVGYHLWYQPSVLLASVLVDDRMDLMIATLDDGKYRVLEKNVGRSLQIIPGTRFVSYISKAKAPTSVLMSLDPENGSTTKIIDMPEDSEDICWLPNGIILAASGQSLWFSRPGPVRGWSRLLQFSDPDIRKVTRLSVNSEGTWLALVSE